MTVFRPPRAVWWIGLIVCATGQVTSALAQDERRPAGGAKHASAEDRAHYQKGITQYELGDYQGAIIEFKTAYASSSNPGLLFNIAQSYRLMKDYSQALQFYRTYLRLSPHARNRVDVEKLVAEVERLAKAAADERARQAEQPPKAAPLPELRLPAAAAPAPSPPAVSLEVAVTHPTPHRPWWKHWWVWTLAGGAVAASATIAVLATTVGNREVLPSGKLGTLDAR
jgi:tetratricopeptide (TPR) repeat protein